ncbi:hypothetical protein BHE74_00015188 [Ensete ventricosum]|nr:hypothetical protein BHE74_00015188 [Ensete ventricosum]
MERHNLTLASTRVHVLDLCLRKALCFCFMFPIFCVDSLHVAWILHQIPPKLLHL